MKKHHGDKKGLVKTAGLISLCTVLSRVTGLFRDILSAQVFGISRFWDAFVYAFMIPNFLRRIVGEGALSSAFIPVYAQVLKEKGRKEADKVSNVVFSFLVVSLGSFLIFAHFVIRLIMRWNFLSDNVFLMLELLLILFPYIFFLALFALCMGVLHCHKKFFAPAITPFLLNVVWLVSIVCIARWWGSSLHDKIILLAWCILFAGFVQFALNYIVLKTRGFSFRFSFNWRNPVLAKVLKLMLPAVIGFSITQVNVFVDLSLAMFIGDGANSALWYGTRLMQFPLGVFAIAMGTALLPVISHQIADNNIDGFKSTLSFSLRSVFLVVIPASVGLIVLRQPIMRIFFERGAFDSIATDRAANTLLFYCIGLFAYSGIKLIVSAFYSMQDTKTPVKVGAICMVVNIGFNLILMQFLREAGLAFATALSSMLNFLLLIWFLRKKIGAFEELRVFFAFLRISFVSILMGVFAFYLFEYSSLWLSSELTVVLLVRLLGTIFFSCCVYFLLGLFFGVSEMRLVFKHSVVFAKGKIFKNQL